MDRLKYLCLMGIFLTNCRTTKPPAASSVQSSEATLLAEEEPEMENYEVGLAEPTAQDFAQLRSWLSAQETGFELERLEDCQAQLLLQADRVQAKSDIQKAAAALQDDVREALPLYHWCYFHMLTRLEYQLEQQNLGRTYQDRLQQFLRESKALFVLAEVLDRSRQTRLYRSNLQKKYIYLSQAWFGRNLSPLEPTAKTDSRKSVAPYSEK
jgi:hypothetical protein